jgi:hypothetical protein
MKPEKKKRFCASHVRSSAAVISLAIHAVLIVVAPAFGAVVYIDAAPGNTTLETSGALAEGVNFTKSGSAGSASDGLWHERTRATVNGGSIWTAQAALSSTEAPERLVTQFVLPGEGTYTIFGYQWINADGGGTWDCGFQLGSGSNVAYTKNNATDISATSGHFTTAVLLISGGTASYPIPSYQVRLSSAAALNPPSA